MLHECGHILVSKSDGDLQCNDIYKEYKSSSKIHKVFTVIEEVEAWKRGYKLAGRLSIEIDDKKWNRDVARALWKYMDWATS